MTDSVTAYLTDSLTAYMTDCLTPYLTDSVTAYMTDSVTPYTHLCTKTCKQEAIVLVRRTTCMSKETYKRDL